MKGIFRKWKQRLAVLLACACVLGIINGNAMAVYGAQMLPAKERATVSGNDVRDENVGGTVSGNAEKMDVLYGLDGKADYTFDTAIVEDAPVGELLYFVDAGDYDISTVADGEMLGILNSKTDQLYGKDEVTGYSWGLTSLDDGAHDTLLANGEKGQCKTRCQFSNNMEDITRGYTDWETGLSGIYEGAVSMRYGTEYDPFGVGIIRYDFELPAGYYEVEVGFMSPWSDGYNAEVKVNGKRVATGRVTNGRSAVLKGTVKVRDGQTPMKVESIGEWGPGIQVAYLKVYKGEAAYSFDETMVEDAPVDELLYFVDAGDYDTSTVAEGEKLGILNSKTDQLYDLDEKSGYSWGLASLDDGVVDTLLTDGPNGQCKTNCQTSDNGFDIVNRGYADWGTGLSDIYQDTVSLRYGTNFDPFGKGIIRYDFEVPSGYYDIEVGFMAPFNGGYDTKLQVNGKGIANGYVEKGCSAVLKDTVRVEAGQTPIKVECIGDYGSGVQVAYIKVYKSEESRYHELGEGEVLIEELSDGGYKMTNRFFEVEIGKLGQVRALYIVGDEYRTNYVIDTELYGIGHGIGDLIFSVRKGQEEGYKEYFTTTSGNGRTITVEDDKVVVTYKDAAGDKAISGFTVVETWQYVDNQLRWSVTVENTGDTDMVVGDWGIPIQFNENLSAGEEEVYQRRVVDHSFVGMDSSYLYAIRPNGEGHYLLFSPEASTGAKLEYMDHWSEEERGGETSYVGGLFVYYIHSDNIKSTNRGYLNTHTSLHIPAGESKTYAFNFTGVEDEQDMRSTLYEEDMVDMVAVPGFAYSVNMPGKIYLHTKAAKEDIRVSIECPHESNVYNYDSLGSNVYSVMEHTKTDENTYAKYNKTVWADGEQYHVYDLKFTEFGHHNLIVTYMQDGMEKQAVSQFYMMDNVENMLNDHAEFMVEKTQLDRPGKVGNKVFDEWWLNIKDNRIATFGENDSVYFQMNYWGWGDDWGATHAQFLAEMNANSPKADQVEALDAYLDVAIWNELMREHQKDYRIHDFLVEAPNTSPDGRGYAYPHIYNTFFSMYKIASTYPDMMKYREDAATYLLRAYNIFCTQNSGTVGYGANCGTMGESSIPDMIHALEKEGYYEEAEHMLQIMQKMKYEAFENRLYPYGSEYPYDNVAEEGVFIAALLAQEYGFDSNPIMTPIERIKALDSKTRACRGIQPLWYYYANPVTICNENWWNFQYSCALAAVPMDNWIRLQDNGMTQEEQSISERVNYAAKLGNLTCVNSGQICADPETIGTVVWSYQSELGNYAATGDIRFNGWRHRAGESGLNLWGAVRILSADVTNDPIFGLFGYGCEVAEENGAYVIKPLDGLRKRLHLINETVSIELNRDQYTTATVKKDGTGFTMNVESTGEAHNLELDVYGLKAGSYKVTAGDYSGTFSVTDKEISKVVIPVAGKGMEVIVTRTAETGELDVQISAQQTAFVSDTVKLYGTAVLGAQAITAEAYEWTVAPSDSAKIQDADKAVAKMHVSEAGEYKVTLKVTVGGRTVSKDVTVNMNQDPELKELVARFTFEDDTIDGKDEKGANINNNAVVNSVGDSMGYTILSSNFQKMEDGKEAGDKAARFTGDIKGGYIEFNSDVLSRLESATILFDICLKNNQANDAALMNLGDEIVVYFTEGNTLALRVGEKEISTEIAIASDYWKSVALVADGEDYILYLEGKECVSLKDTGIILNQIGDSKRYLIGRNQGENESFYNGLMDNFTIRSSALSAEEISDLVEEKEHKPLSVPEMTLVTTVGSAPLMPEQIRVLYTDGVYEMTDVEWQAIAPERYSKNGMFIARGKVKGGLSVKVQVLVVSGESVQLEQLPDTSADSIMGNRSTWREPACLITNPEPESSSNWGEGAWQNWGDGSQNQKAWVSYTWDMPKVIIGSDAYFGIDWNNNFFPKSYELEYLDENNIWMPIKNHSGYDVAYDDYSKVTFNPVVAKGIRLTMNPSKDGSAILKWKVYGWPDADITVTEVPVTGVELNKESIDFTATGETETLTAVITPEDATNQEVSWISDNPAVATVDQNGKVTAVAEGTANIIITTVDGGKTAVCVVTVKVPITEHVHDKVLKEVKEKEAICTEDGNKGYYICESCGKWFADAEGKDVITDHDSVVIKAMGHILSSWKYDEKGHWKDCTVCGTVQEESKAHSLVCIVDKEATKDAAGSKHEECTICGYKKGAVTIPALGGDTPNPEKPEPSEDPETPNNPENSSEVQKKLGESPKTGDSSNIKGCIILLLIASAGVSGMVYYRKRRSMK